MLRSRITESQNVAILKEVEGGAKVHDLSSVHGIGIPTIYNWRAK